MSDYCPKCGVGPLESGELLDGSIAIKWPYCEECHWQGNPMRYRLFEVPYGTAYKLDQTVTPSSVAAMLGQKLSGRFQLPKTFAPCDPDYRAIIWKRQKYMLTPNQSRIIKKLHTAYLAGAPDVPKEDLLSEIQSPGGRVRDSFKSNHILWRGLITHERGTRRGSLRLKL
jgi:hypothetical protein